jgi:hypothetical protein
MAENARPMEPPPIFFPAVPPSFPSFNAGVGVVETASAAERNEGAAAEFSFHNTAARTAPRPRKKVDTVNGAAGPLAEAAALR